MRTHTFVYMLYTWAPVICSSWWLHVKLCVWMPEISSVASHVPVSLSWNSSTRESVSLESTAGSPPPHLPPLLQSRRHEGPTPQQGSPEVPGSPECPCGAVNCGRPSRRSCGAPSLSAMTRRSRRRQYRRRWAQRSSDAACPTQKSCWDMRHHPPGLHRRQTIPWLSAVLGSRTPHFHLRKNRVWLGQAYDGF